jgi:hypothetical protein
MDELGRHLILNPFLSMFIDNIGEESRLEKIGSLIIPVRYSEGHSQAQRRRMSAVHIAIGRAYLIP